MLYGLIGNTRTLSVIGMCKNAGKTTALNKLIRACESHGDTLGLTSIGRDGERSDVVTNTKKPEIFVQEGTIIATASALLNECDISREILSASGIPSPMGEIVLARARSAGFVQIGGPSMTAGLTVIRDELYSYGCTRVFIDGAISRKSLGAPQIADGVILCSGASYDVNMRKTAGDTAYIASLFSLPVFNAPADASADDSKYSALIDGRLVGCSSVDELMPLLKKGFDAVLVRGAFTDKTASELLTCGKLLSGKQIIAEDASRLLLGRQMYERLKRVASGFAVLKGAKLLAVTVNPFSAYGNHYDKTAFADEVFEASRIAGVEVPIIDVTEV